MFIKKGSAVTLGKVLTNIFLILFIIFAAHRCNMIGVEREALVNTLLREKEITSSKPFTVNGENYVCRPTMRLP